LLLDYALRACGCVDTLAVTHLDALPGFDPFHWCARYAATARLELPSSLAEQELLTQALSSAQPYYSAPPAWSVRPTPEVLCRSLAEATGIPVKYGSFGPRADNVVPTQPE
jgi:adenylosuccinate synthase